MREEQPALEAVGKRHDNRCIAASVARDTERALAHWLTADLRAGKSAACIKFAPARTKRAIVGAHRDGPVWTARRVDKLRRDISI